MAGNSTRPIAYETKVMLDGTASAGDVAAAMNGTCGDSFERLRCPGIRRDGPDAANALVLLLNRKPTDDEMRFIHRTVQRALSTALVNSDNDHGEQR